MNAASLGNTVFASLPNWIKGAVVFTRNGISSYDPVSGSTTTETITARSQCVVQPARGTQSESFLALTTLREKYISATVQASPLGDFHPQAQDEMTIGASTYVITGVESVQPDGATTPAIYICTAERLNG